MAVRNPLTQRRSRGHWSDLGNAHRIGFAVSFALIGWLALSVLRGPVTTPTPSANALILSAAPGTSDVTPESMRAASLILMDRATDMGAAVVVVWIDGNRFAVDLGRAPDAGTVAVLTAPGRVRVSAATQIDTGGGGSVPAAGGPAAAVLTDAAGTPVVARGAPLASSDSLTAHAPGPRDASRSVAVLRAAGPDEARVRERLRRTALVVAIDDTLLPGHHMAVGSHDAPGDIEVRIDGGLLLPAAFAEVRARLVHGPLPLTLTRVS